MSDDVSEIREAISNGEIELARELLRKEPRSPTADAYYLASQVALSDSQRVQFLEKALEFDHQNATLHYALGHACSKAGEYDKSVVYYSSALENYAECVEAYVNRGASYFNHFNDYRAALRDFTAALAIQPAHALAHVCLGNVMGVLGEYGKAKSEYELALELDPGKESHAHSSASRELQETRAEVKKAKRRCLSSLRNSAEATASDLNRTAYEMCIAGLFGEAASALEMGLQRDPAFSYFYATKGRMYFRQEDVKPGLELYGRAMTMSPDDLALRRKFHYEYGMALRIQCKFDEAIKELESALITDSEHVWDELIELEISRAEREDGSE